jgi:hypothetical protein
LKSAINNESRVSDGKGQIKNRKKERPRSQRKIMSPQFLKDKLQLIPEPLIEIYVKIFRFNLLA